MIGRLIRAVLAAVLLVVLLAGIPATLLAIVGNPWPALSGIDLMAQLSAEQLMAALSVAIWALWAQFAVSVVAETVEQARDVAVSIPGTIGSRAVAHYLVGAIVAVTATGGGLATAVAAAPAAGAADVVSNAGTTTSQTTGVAAPTAASASSSAPRTAAAGPVETAAPSTTAEPLRIERHGESLWAIADRHLGDPHRWTEIRDLNRGRTMTDGAVFTSADRIRVGWELRMPADSTHLDQPRDQSAPDGDEPRAAHDTRVDPGESLSDIAADELGDANDWPSLWRQNRGEVQNDGSRFTDPDLIQPGWKLTVPGTAAPQDAPAPERTPPPQSRSGAERPQAPAQPPAAEPTVPEPTAPQTTPQAPQGTAPAPGADGSLEDGQRAEPPAASADPVVGGDATDGESADDEGAEAAMLTAAGAGALLAAGVGALMWRRRQRQRWSRGDGERLPRPPAPAAATEAALRTVADPMGADLVNLALRSLAADAGSSEQTLPPIRFARLTAEAFELYLTEPVELTEPFAATQDPAVWTVSRDAAAALRDRQADLELVRSPFPALVTLGHDDDGVLVLADLEQLGVLDVVGDPGQTREVLAALTIELATSLWGDHVRVTVVGGFADLDEGLDTGRVVHSTIDRVLHQLDRKVDVDHRRLEELGVRDAIGPRIDPDDESGWPPQIIVVLGELDEDRRGRLAELAERLPRVAYAVITQDSDVGQWSLRLSGSERRGGLSAVLNPVGLPLTLQRIDRDTYRHLIQLVETTGGATQRPEPADPASEPVDDAGQGAAVVDDPPVATVSVLRPRPVASEPTATDTVDEAASAGAAEEAEPEGEPVAPPVPMAGAQERPEPAGYDEPATPAPPVEAVTAAAPFVRVLGPTVVVEGARGSLASGRRGKALEVAAYLALRPGRGPQEWSQALDAANPDKSKAQQANFRGTRMSHLRDWLGENDEGEPYVPHVGADGYRFHPDVRVDWDVWRSLVGESGPSVAAASSEDLETALRLVRGRPLGAVEATERSSYTAWAFADADAEVMAAVIVDAARELGRRRLLESRWTQAEWAISLGLTCAAHCDEVLWQLRIRCAYASGNPEEAGEAIKRMLAFMERLEVDMSPETAALLAQLEQRPDRAAVVEAIR